MAANNWQLIRDLGLARLNKNASEVTRLENAIAASQADCVHISNPEAPERCYKCGASLREEGQTKGL